MTVYSAWRDGIRRVNAAPAIILGVWLLTVLVSLPFTLVARNAGATPGRKPRGRLGRERRQLRLDAGVRRSGDRARRDIRADHHRVRRRPRQPRGLPRQPASP